MYLVKIYHCLDRDEHRMYDSIALLGLANTDDEAKVIANDFIRFKAIAYLLASEQDMTNWTIETHPVTEEMFYDEALYPTAPIEYFDIRVEPYSERYWGKTPDIDLSGDRAVKVLRGIRNYGYNLNNLDFSDYDLDMYDPEIAALFNT